MQVKRQRALIQEKVDEIKRQLEEWAMEKKILGAGERIEFSLWVQYTPAVVPKTHEEILAMTLYEFAKTTNQRTRILRLSRWCYHPVNTVGELIQRSATELLETKNFGITALAAVTRRLQELGLSLRDE